MCRIRELPEAISDVIGGRADWYFAPLSSALPLIQSGKLQGIGSSVHRKGQTLLPNVPTTIEAGIPNSDYVFWVGLIAPSGTPAASYQKTE
jgi:tripartite-type tricarboxylate transporter receptor subunit TctC